MRKRVVRWDVDKDSSLRSQSCQFEFSILITGAWARLAQVVSALDQRSKLRFLVRNPDWTVTIF
jgi:hypothetical protein